MRGAALYQLKKDFYRHISIHAPHAGSGMAGLFEQFDSQKFQSTLPMRGAALHNKSF